jgi:hypothetical protein
MPCVLAQATELQGKKRLPMYRVISALASRGSSFPARLLVQGYVVKFVLSASRFDARIQLRPRAVQNTDEAPLRQVRA